MTIICRKRRSPFYVNRTQGTIWTRSFSTTAIITKANKGSQTDQIYEVSSPFSGTFRFFAETNIWACTPFQVVGKSEFQNISNVRSERKNYSEYVKWRKTPTAPPDITSSARMIAKLRLQQLKIVSGHLSCFSSLAKSPFSEFRQLVNELNRMPMSGETLRIRNRKMEIEKALIDLENTIRNFSKSKVYVKDEK